MQPQELIRSSRLRISTSYWPPLAERARKQPKNPNCGSSATTSIPSVRPRQMRSEISSSSLVSQPGDGFRSSTALALRFDGPLADAVGFDAVFVGIRRTSLAANRWAETIPRARGAPQSVWPFRAQEFGAIEWGPARAEGVAMRGSGG